MNQGSHLTNLCVTDPILEKIFDAGISLLQITRSPDKIVEQTPDSALHLLGLKDGEFSRSPFAIAVESGRIDCLRAVLTKLSKEDFLNESPFGLSPLVFASIEHDSQRHHCRQSMVSLVYEKIQQVGEEALLREVQIQNAFQFDIEMHKGLFFETILSSDLIRLHYENDIDLFRIACDSGNGELASKILSLIPDSLIGDGLPINKSTLAAIIEQGNETLACQILERLNPGSQTMKAASQTEFFKMALSKKLYRLAEMILHRSDQIETAHLKEAMENALLLSETREYHARNKSSFCGTLWERIKSKTTSCSPLPLSWVFQAYRVSRYNLSDDIWAHIQLQEKSLREPLIQDHYLDRFKELLTLDTNRSPNPQKYYQMINYYWDHLNHYSKQLLKSEGSLNFQKAFELQKNYQAPLATKMIEFLAESTDTISQKDIRESLSFILSQNSPQYDDLTLNLAKQLDFEQNPSVIASSSLFSARLTQIGRAHV